MDLELVTIGTELLLGHTVDTNAAYLARALAAAGARVSRKTTVPDELPAIREAVAAGLGRCRFVVTTGGLGPTRDDVTKRAVAELFGVPLVTDAAYLRRLEARWARLARPGPMPEANRTQAEVPEGAQTLPNPRGTAPGLWIDGSVGTVVMLPGVPHEMRGLTDGELIPRVAARAGGGTVTRWRTLRTTGIAESAIADRLGPLEDELAPVTLAYLPSFEGTDLRLTVWQVAAVEADALLARAAERVHGVMGGRVYGEGGDDLAAVVLGLARQAGARIAVAESCTGGLVGGRLTAVPGSSDVFVGGVIAYANAVKTAQLGVPPELLASDGAVSEPVVRAMLDGVRDRFGADAAIAVSGIAGPDGGTAEKPVGTVWLGAAWGGSTRSVRIGFPGDREEVRARAAQAGLDLLRHVLSEGAGG